MHTKRITYLHKLLAAACPTQTGLVGLEKSLEAFNALRLETLLLARELDTYEGLNSIWNEDEFEEKCHFGDAVVMVSFKTKGDYCVSSSVLINGYWCSVDDCIPYNIQRRWDDEMTSIHQERLAQDEFDARQEG